MAPQVKTQPSCESKEVIGKVTVYNAMSCSIFCWAVLALSLQGCGANVGNRKAYGTKSIPSGFKLFKYQLRVTPKQENSRAVFQHKNLLSSRQKEKNVTSPSVTKTTDEKLSKE